VTTCDDVRPLLTDHALGSLAPGDEDVVSRHLRGCASCRRELEALREGAGVFGSSFDRTPPPELRERVLEVLGEEWADADRAARPERRRGALAIAAALALALVAGAAAVIQTARAEGAGDDAAAYRAVLATLGGTGFRVGNLEPAGSTRVEGSVVAYESSHDQSFVVVFVRAPRLEGEGQLLATRADGTSWDPGPIAFDGDGDAAVWWVTDRSIASMSGLTVRAPDGSVLATASLRDA
jgi:anti-sigma factor RsiW